MAEPACAVATGPVVMVLDIVMAAQATRFASTLVTAPVVEVSVVGLSISRNSHRL